MKYYWTNQDKRIQYCLVGLILVTLGLVIFAGIHRANLNKELDKQIIQTQTLKAKIVKRQNELDEQAQTDSLNSTNLKIRESTNQAFAERKVQSTVKVLFPILLNFDNQSDYVKRPKKAAPYLTKKVQQSQNLFQKDKLGSGNFIGSAQLHEKFISAQPSVGLIKSQTVPVTVAVQFESWLTGKRHGVAEDIYIGTYDCRSNKFTKLKRVNTTYMGTAGDN